jgi:hypothetical protein
LATPGARVKALAAALSIPAAADPLGQLVAEHFEKLQLITDAAMVTPMLNMGDEFDVDRERVFVVWR